MKAIRKNARKETIQYNIDCLKAELVGCAEERKYLYKAISKLEREMGKMIIQRNKLQTLIKTK